MLQVNEGPHLKRFAQISAALNEYSCVQFQYQLSANVSRFMQGCTPLHGCAETYKHEDMLRKYSNRCQRGNPERMHAAAELAVLLLDHGADPEAQNHQVHAVTHTCSDSA